MVDADVHCAPPPIEDVLPYLADHWQDYIAENGFTRSAAIDATYPPWREGLATSPDDADVEAIRRNVLSRSSHAIVNCYYGVDPILNPYFASALASAINDWLQHDVLDKDERLLGSLTVTPQSPEDAADEIDRMAGDPRFVQVLLPARSWELYGKRRFRPIWEAATRHGLAVAIHYGGLSGNPHSAVGRVDTYFEEYVNAAQLFQAHLASVVGEGIFETYPDVRIVLLESGVTWLPAHLWKMDQTWKILRREVPWISRPPSASVRQHVRLTVEPLDAPDQAAHLAEVIEQLGSDEMLMYASDHPHRHESDFAELVSLLSPVQVERLNRTNAWECYGLEERLQRAAVSR